MIACAIAAIAATVASPARADEALAVKTQANDPARPPPLQLRYAQIGMAFAATINIDSGATCGSQVIAPVQRAPCILGSGGGLVLRAGYRPPGRLYFGGAYEFAKMDSSNLYRLGIFQQLRAEMRYIFDIGYRIAPYVSWGAGGVLYGNEWGVETGGAMVYLGGGIGFEVSRHALLGLGIEYRPTLLAAFKDTAGIERPLGLSQFLGVELQLEVRTQLEGKR